MIALTGQFGESAERAAANAAQLALQGLFSKSGSVISKSLAEDVRAYFAKRWPGSKNFSARSVRPGPSKAQEGQALVSAKGASRAYGDVRIAPVRAKRLTIPMHASAYGKKASDFEGLFKVTKKDGREFLAKHDGGSLVMMFFLSKGVTQRRDRSVMPSDEALAAGCARRLAALAGEVINR